MNLTLHDLQPDEAVAMADALLRVGKVKMAAQLYRSALRHVPVDRSGDIRTRLGLASSPTHRTQLMLRMTQELSALTPHVFVGDGLATWFKTLPFFEDERFVELAERHAHLSPLPNWHWNLQTVLWAVNQAKSVPGDMIELGVFKGHTTRFLADYVEFQTWEKRWLLYDTFAGIPEDQLDAGWVDSNRSTYGGTFSFEEVAARFADVPNITVIQGRVPEILEGTCPEAIAFAHIDLNNMAAEIQALDYIYDRLSPGAVVVLDDYGWAAARAQHVAENAWFAAKGLQILPLPTGQGLFIKA